MRASIVHVPKGLSADDWSHNYINIMPAGTYSVANYAIKRGHAINVLNSAIFKTRETALDRIFNTIGSNDSQAVGMPLHWHLTGADVLFAAERIKERCPQIKIVLGGITASILGEEIMRACPAIDAVVHGDGEEPFARYLDELDRGKADCSLGDVPNLCWRNGDNVVFNSISYVASPAEYSSFDYGISRVVEDFRQYLNGPTMFDAVAGRTKDLLTEPVGQKVFFVNLGRGCSYNCVYCGGSLVSFKRYFGRGTPVVRSVDAVLGTVRDAYALGFRRYHFCWDCAFGGKDAYIHDLFTRMRREIGDDLSLIYEIYRPPSPTFIQLCSESFYRCTLILSPTFFDQTKMRRYMGFDYSHEQLEGCLRCIVQYPNCTPFVFFGITPLEDWSEKGITQKVSVMKRLKQDFGCKVSAMPIYAEPGSPWVTFPEVFRTNAFNLSFTDFLNEWRKPLTPWNDTLAGMRDTQKRVDFLEYAMGVDKLC